MDAQSRELMKHNVDAVPLIETVPDSTYIIDEQEGLVAWNRLRANGSSIPDHTEVQVELVKEEVIKNLNTTPDGKRFIITQQELHGILARTAIRSAGQAIVDIGGVMSQVRSLNEALLISESESD